MLPRQPPLPRHLTHLSSDASIHRIRANGSASLVQWLPCVETGTETLHSFADASRPSTRNPPLHSLCCFPKHSRCFRAVYDDTINIELEMPPPDKHAHCPAWAALEPSECSKNAAFMLRQCATSCRAAGFVGDEGLNDPFESRSRAISHQIQALLQERLGVGKIEEDTSRFRTYEPHDFGQRSEFAPWQELHADYFQVESYVFSAVLFLGLEEYDTIQLAGGEVRASRHLCCAALACQAPATNSRHLPLARGRPASPTS